MIRCKRGNPWTSISANASARATRTAATPREGAAAVSRCQAPTFTDYATGLPNALPPSGRLPANLQIALQLAPLLALCLPDFRKMRALYHDAFSHFDIYSLALDHPCWFLFRWTCSFSSRTCDGDGDHDDGYGDGDDNGDGENDAGAGGGDADNGCAGDAAEGNGNEDCDDGNDHGDGGSDEDAAGDGDDFGWWQS